MFFTVKEGVDIRFLRQEIVRYLPNIWSIFTYHAPKGFIPTITSGREGRHKPGSKHYKDLAVDLRIWYIDAGQRVYLTPVQLDHIVRDLRVWLGADYQFVLHKTHLHLEYDP